MIDWEQPGLDFCRLIFDTSSALHELAFAEMIKKGANLTMRQCVAIKEMSEMLKDHPDGVQLKELAARLELTPGTVSELVDTLVGRGIFHRDTDAADRRKVRIRLSDDYYARLEEGIGRMAGIAVEVLEGVKKADRGRLAAMLGKIQEKLENMRSEKEKEA